MIEQAEAQYALTSQGIPLPSSQNFAPQSNIMLTRKFNNFASFAPSTDGGFLNILRGQNHETNLNNNRFDRERGAGRRGLTA